MQLKHSELGTRAKGRQLGQSDSLPGRAELITCRAHTFPGKHLQTSTLPGSGVMHTQIWYTFCPERRLAYCKSIPFFFFKQSNSGFADLLGPRPRQPVQGLCIVGAFGHLHGILATCTFVQLQ